MLGFLSLYSCVMNPATFLFNVFILFCVSSTYTTTALLSSLSFQTLRGEHLPYVILWEEFATQNVLMMIYKIHLHGNTLFHSIKEDKPIDAVHVL